MSVSAIPVVRHRYDLYDDTIRCVRMLLGRRCFARYSPAKYLDKVTWSTRSIMLWTWAADGGLVDIWEIGEKGVANGIVERRGGGFKGT